MAIELHTVQDFYAHSTWVEHHKGIVTNPYLGTSAFVASPSTAATCSQHSILSGAPLTGGYFDVIEIFDPYKSGPHFLDWYTNAYKSKGGESTWPDDRCVHGYTTYGISKDKKGRLNFEVAYDDAISATRLYVVGIIRALWR